ncbi:MAG: hypothetical protein ACP5N1_04760 [Candidatus Woesearchaeota archaeon]
MNLAVDRENIALSEEITLSDKLVYTTIGVGSAVAGHSLSALEKIANIVENNLKIDAFYKNNKFTEKITKVTKILVEECHNHSGPMLWLSEYILGKEKNKKITFGNKYYNDWLEHIDFALTKETRDYINHNDLYKPGPHCLYVDKKSSCPIAQMLLQKGLSYGRGSMFADGLCHMIGYATVGLDDSKLISIDKFDFKKVSDHIELPKIVNPFLKIASRFSPILAANIRQYGNRYVISDQYFNNMGGNEFYTILEGSLTDLNKLGWNFE